MIIKHNIKAFTLIEILVSMVILSIGFSIIFRSYQFCISALTDLSETTTANALMSKVYDDLNIQIMTNNFELPPLENTFEYPFEEFSYQIDLSPVEFANFDAYTIENDGNLYELKISVLQKNSDKTYSCKTKIYLPESAE